jgi:hypothetical protein
MLYALTRLRQVSVEKSKLFFFKTVPGQVIVWVLHVIMTMTVRMILYVVSFVRHMDAEVSNNVCNHHITNADDDVMS